MNGVISRLAREYDDANARYQETGNNIARQRARIACLLAARLQRPVGAVCQQYLDTPRIAQAVQNGGLADEIRIQRNQLSGLFPAEAARRIQRLEALDRYGEALGDYVELLEAQGRTQELATILEQNYANQESIEFIVPALGTQSTDVGWETPLIPEDDGVTDRRSSSVTDQRSQSAITTDGTESRTSSQGYVDTYTSRGRSGSLTVDRSQTEITTESTSETSDQRSELREERPHQCETQGNVPFEFECGVEEDGSFSFGGSFSRWCVARGWKQLSRRREMIL